MKRQLTHGSLFSGIGGAELAAHWAGFTNLFHCEINPFGRQVLDYWFPKSKSYENVKTTDFTEWRGRVDVLTAGFPCQPFSSAGKRKGADDDRYLWPETLRVLREVRPAWFIGENVAGLLTMVEQREVTPMGSQATLFSKGDGLFHYRATELYTIERICGELNAAGYSVQPFVIPACAVGAPHRRDRVWIVARRDDDDKRVLRDGTTAHTSSLGLQTVGTQADAQKQGLGRKHADGLCLQDGEIPRPHWQAFPTQPPILGGDNGLPFAVDNLAIPYGKLRTETIKAMGNAWVPQVAHEIFLAIKEAGI